MNDKIKDEDFLSPERKAGLEVAISWFKGRGNGEYPAGLAELVKQIIDAAIAAAPESAPSVRSLIDRGYKIISPAAWEVIRTKPTPSQHIADASKEVERFGEAMKTLADFTLRKGDTPQQLDAAARALGYADFGDYCGKAERLPL